MEWVTTELATVGGVLLVVVVSFMYQVRSQKIFISKMVDNVGKRADPAVLSIITTMQENESKRDEAQAAQAASQAESLKSLAASQESQAKSMKYLGQLSQGMSNALGVMMEQFKPLPPMAASIQVIEAQSKTMVINMEELTGNSEQWEPLLKEIIRRLDGVQRTLDELNPVVSKTQNDLKETEREVATIRGAVLDIQKEATKKQEIPAVKPEPIEQGAKPDERTTEQLDDLAGGGSSAGDDKRHGDGGGSEASDIAPVA